MATTSAPTSTTTATSSVRITTTLPTHHQHHADLAGVGVECRDEGDRGYGLAPSDANREGPLDGYKLLDMAQVRWRRLDGAHLLPLVRADVVFADGIQQEGKAPRTKARAA